MKACSLLLPPSLFLITLLATCHASGPLILVFTPGQPAFGQELATIIRQDGRLDAEITVLTNEALFEAMLYLPRVKLVIISLAKDSPRPSWEDMGWFFREGGGMLGLGFAGSTTSTFNASTSAFPLFANDYKSGRYDPPRKRFIQTFLKEQEHEITHGLGDFEAPAQRIVLSYNSSTGEYLPRQPESGEWQVLYRDAAFGAPVVVAYQEAGASVTFATYGGEDFNRSFGHFAIFSRTEEFLSLFLNSAEWIWNRESKYEDSVSAADSHLEELSRRKDEIRAEAQDQLDRAATRRLITGSLTLLIAAASCVAIYWAVLVRPGRRS